MARTETVRPASPMDGDDLYQRRARAALPLLVRQAKARMPITYGSLAKELGMENPRNLNYPLGCIGRSLQRLSEQWNQPIPELQTLVINKHTKIPSSGSDKFLDEFKTLSPRRQLERVKTIQRSVYDYRRWDEVINALGLNPNSLEPNLIKELFDRLTSIPYDDDQRHPPDRRRYGQFVVGWNDATDSRQGHGYTQDTLRSLTWRNLGFRLGDYFGTKPKEEIEQIWNALVSHYERTRGIEAVDLAEQIDISPLVEGAKKRVFVNAYERNLTARAQCLATHGVVCVICGFSFGKRYGLVAEGYIHVHHLKPLSEINTSYIVDPTRDLRPVCPNCHAVIHRRKPPFTLDEVRDMLAGGESGTDT